MEPDQSLLTDSFDDLVLPEDIDSRVTQIEGLVESSFQSFHCLRQSYQSIKNTYGVIEIREESYNSRLKELEKRHQNSIAVVHGSIKTINSKTNEAYSDKAVAASRFTSTLKEIENEVTQMSYELEQRVNLLSGSDEKLALATSELENAVLHADEVAERAKSKMNQYEIANQESPELFDEKTFDELPAVLTEISEVELATLNLRLQIVEGGDIGQRAQCDETEGFIADCRKKVTELTDLLKEKVKELENSKSAFEAEINILNDLIEKDEHQLANDIAENEKNRLSIEETMHRYEFDFEKVHACRLDDLKVLEEAVRQKEKELEERKKYEFELDELKKKLAKQEDSLKLATENLDVAEKENIQDIAFTEDEKADPPSTPISVKLRSHDIKKKCLTVAKIDLDAKNEPELMHNSADSDDLFQERDVITPPKGERRFFKTTRQNSESANIWLQLGAATCVPRKRSIFKA